MNDAWLEAPILDCRKWAEGLVTLRFDAELEPYQPGQWTNLALRCDGELVRRAYSLASAPGEPPELFLNLVPGGTFTPRLFALGAGERVLIEKRPQGFFTLSWVPDAEELWLCATGTGLAPFVSILRHDEVWRRFRRIVLVHGVRQVDQLGYKDEFSERARAHDNRLTWVPIVSREPDAQDVLVGRVTRALESGELERYAGLELSPERSHVMLCGNPEMIMEMSTLLDARGLRKHRQRKPGHVTSEKFWDTPKS